jgi:hypothetical protein
MTVRRPVSLCDPLYHTLPSSDQLSGGCTRAAGGQQHEQQVRSNERKKERIPLIRYSLSYFPDAHLPHPSCGYVPGRG